jgi:hypothetical protein
LAEVAPLTWDEVLAAVSCTLSGDRADGRAALLDCWTRAGAADHAQRCVLAHHLADLEDDVDAEVGWDEQALAAFAGVTDDGLEAIGVASAAGLAPSLHLNLGDGYRRQGRHDAAREQHDLGVTAAAALPDDGYGATVRRGLERLGQRLAT